MKHFTGYPKNYSRTFIKRIYFLYKNNFIKASKFNELKENYYTKKIIL